MKQVIVNLLRDIRTSIVFICSKNRFLAKLFFLVDSTFDREFEYTLKGRYESLSARYDHDYSNANMRRCVHRIEKGLFHRDRRDQFGKDLILELRREVLSLKQQAFIDKNEVDWAINTLTDYRDFCHDVSIVDECLAVLNEVSVSAVDSTEFESVDNQDFETLKHIYQNRSSVRFFTKQPVAQKDIEAAVSIAKLAPTACNRQPFSVHILEKREDIDFVGGMAPGSAGFLDNIPTLAVVVGHVSSFRFARDRHLIHTDSGLFLGHLLPALKSLGLASCVLNWVSDWNNDRRAVEYLGLDLSKSIICLVAIGHQDENCTSPISTKKTNSVLLRYK